MDLAAEARLFKWVCYRCAREIFSPANATCPSCAFPLVIECDESPAPSLWREELVQAQRALRLPVPLLLFGLANAVTREDAMGDLPPPPEIARAAARPSRSVLVERALQAAVPIRRTVLTFTGVALATFVVAWAVAAFIQFGF